MWIRVWVRLYTAHLLNDTRTDDEVHSQEGLKSRAVELVFKHLQYLTKFNYIGCEIESRDYKCLCRSACLSDSKFEVPSTEMASPEILVFRDIKLYPKLNDIYLNCFAML
jgi:hypothetical protein